MVSAQIVTVPGPEDLPMAVVDRMATVIEGAVRDRGVCRVALAGGNTPRPIYAELAAHYRGVPWGQMELYFGDERCVPPTHIDSNFRMAKEALLEPGRIPLGRVFRMEAEALDRDTAARRYERLLPDQLDLILLGMGPDGHTASLFPGSDAVREWERTVVVVRGPKPPPWRLTITPPVILAARAVFVLAVGADKAGTVARALRGPRDIQAVPVQLASGGVWFLDKASASQLSFSGDRMG